MIKGRTADIILSMYILITLYIRFTIEDTLQFHPFLSVTLGFIMLLIIWSVVKLKWLSPNYFGLFNNEK